MSRLTTSCFATMLLALSAGVPAVALTTGDVAYEDGYQAANYGRVLYDENGLSIRRSANEPLERAGINAPIFPGDTVTTGYDQRAEIQLGLGSLVRLDQDTELVFLAMPSPHTEVSDDTVLQLAHGNLRIGARLGESEDFRIDTPSASIYLLGDGDFRIEVSPQGRTWISSRRGVAELVGNDGSVIVRSGMRASVAPGAFPADPEPFNTFVADGFDRWVERREGAIRRASDAGSRQGSDVYDDLPEEVQPYYGELSRDGTWYETEEYGQVWTPAVAEVGWRPYRSGYWHYGASGYFWVSYEPWGWAPYHYGRWSYFDSYGWSWIPGRVFGGAWVGWSWGSAYVGWSPLNYYNYPHYYGGHGHYGHYHGHGHHYDSHSWTFVHQDHVNRRHVTRHAVPVDRVGRQLDDAVVTTRAPRVAPKLLAGSHQARTRALRDVQNNNAARIRPAGGDAKSSRLARGNLADLESKMTSARGRNGRNDRTANSSARDGKLAGQRFQSRPRSAGDANRSSTAAIRSLTNREPRSTRAVAPRTTGAPARTIDARDRDRGRAERSLDSARPESSDRRRDLYRRMAGPRSTRERDDDKTRTSARPSTGRNTGDTRARPSSGRSNSGGSKARPSSGRSNSGGSKARPSSGRSNSGGSKARPSSGRSNSGGSKARPSSGRSNSGGSKARPSSGRSNSGGSKARPSSGRSNSGGSKARPSSGRSNSGGSKARPSSGRSNSGGSKARPSSGRSNSGGSKARPSSGRSNSGGSKARPSSGRSNSGGSKARPSSGRSNSGGSKARPSSGRSNSGGSKARPSSGRSNSGGSKARPSSGRSNSGGSKARPSSGRSSGGSKRGGRGR